MAETIDNNKVYWVRGNTQPFIIPLEQEIVTEGEPIVAEPYYPDENAEIVVNFVGVWKRFPYTPHVDGNLLIFTDNATIPAGNYGVEVIVKNPDGTQRRSMWDNQVVITNSNPSVLQEWDEFKRQDVKARAALFFFAKGDKGDAFTYEDFTQEQIEDLKKPATDAATEAALLEQQIEASEAERVEAEHGRELAEQGRVEDERSRVQAEQGRVDAETLRAQAELGRSQAEVVRSQQENLRKGAEEIREQSELTRNQNELTRQQNESIRQIMEAQRERDMGAIKNDYALVKSGAQQATSDADTAAELANQNAEDANTAAQNANEKGTYAKNKGDYAKEQGDYAKQKGDEVEDAKGTYQNLGARLDAMNTAIDYRLEKITEEQFDEIFN